jgi:hypothetical protein
MNQEAMSIVKRVHGFYFGGGLPGISQNGACLYKMCDPMGGEVGRCAVGCLLSDSGVEEIDRTERITGMEFRTFYNAGFSLGKIHMIEHKLFAARALMDKILDAAGVERKDIMVLIWMQNIHDSVSYNGCHVHDLKAARKTLIEVLESIINGQECRQILNLDMTSVNNLRDHIHG